MTLYFSLSKRYAALVYDGYCKTLHVFISGTSMRTYSNKQANKQRQMLVHSWASTSKPKPPASAPDWFRHRQYFSFRYRMIGCRTVRHLTKILRYVAQLGCSAAEKVQYSSSRVRIAQYRVQRSSAGYSVAQLG
jgi:hypothetical protein